MVELLCPFEGLLQKRVLYKASKDPLQVRLDKRMLRYNSLVTFAVYNRQPIRGDGVTSILVDVGNVRLRRNCEIISWKECLHPSALREVNGLTGRTCWQILA